MASVLTAERIKDVLDLGLDDVPMIKKILPSVKNWVVDYCKNPFLVERESITTLNTPNPLLHGRPNVFRYGDTLAVDADARQITDSDSEFITNGFTSNTDIIVRGSRYNDGVYFCTKAEAGTLTLDEIHSDYLTDENDSDEAFFVSQIQFPPAILLPVAKLVQFDMQKRGADLKSFRLADYSENYAGDGDYPPGLKQRFTPWRNMFI